MFLECLGANGSHCTLTVIVQDGWYLAIAPDVLLSRVSEHAMTCQRHRSLYKSCLPRNAVDLWNLARIEDAVRDPTVGRTNIESEYQLARGTTVRCLGRRHVTRLRCPAQCESGGSDVGGANVA